MSALAAARTTISNKGPIFTTFGYKAKATKVFYNGALVAVDTGGYLVPATKTVGQRVVGVVDLGNLPSLDTTGDTDGDHVLSVKAGVFPFASGTSTNLLTIADLMKQVYVEDDQTVNRLPGATGVVAGYLVKVESTQFFVAVGIGAGSPGSVAASGSTAWQGVGSTENVAAPGAISVLTHETLLTTIDGTDAFTLADGLFIGQEKIVRVSATGANTPVGTITPATPLGFATVTALGVIGDLAVFVWTVSGWIIRSLNGVTQS
jgi:hypothetical protein